MPSGKKKGLTEPGLTTGRVPPWGKEGGKVVTRVLINGGTNFLLFSFEEKDPSKAQPGPPVETPASRKEHSLAPPCGGRKRGRSWVACKHVDDLPSLVGNPTFSQEEGERSLLPYRKTIAHSSESKLDRVAWLRKVKRKRRDLQSLQEKEQYCSARKRRTE